MLRGTIIVVLVIITACTSGPGEQPGRLEKSKEESVDSFYEMSLKTIHGKKVQVTKSDKLIFVNFWATWCRPCIEEMPSIFRLRDKVGDKVDFFLLSYEEPERINTFEMKLNTKLPLYSYDERELPERLQSAVLPYTVVMYQGKVLFEKTGSTVWDSESMVKYLGELKSKTNE